MYNNRQAIGVLIKIWEREGEMKKFNRPHLQMKVTERRLTIDNQE
jgi:hypothetical protein